MLVDPLIPADQQLERQAKIIEALIRRADREKDVGPSAFRAFQSAIELQQQVQEQRRDLARAESELKTARGERERMRKILVEALSSMEEGFALFIGGRLELCNDLFLQLFPDMASRIDAGLGIRRFFAQLAASRHYRSADRNLATLPGVLNARHGEGVTTNVVIELEGDRWFQLSAQNTSLDNVVLLLTDITRIVRRNRTEKETLIDRQEDYLQAVFQTLSSGVCTFSPDGAVMMHNARFAELLDLPETLLTAGQPVEEVLRQLQSQGMRVEGDATSLEDLKKQLIRRGGLRLRVRQGPLRVLDIHIHEIPARGYLAEAKDMTFEARTTEMLENRVLERTAELTEANMRLTKEYEEKARVEEELRQAKERAEAAVSSKTRFLAAASHDLLQPINAAKLLISTLMEQTRGSGMFGLIERLDGSFRSTEQLLHSLLDISRLESAEPDAISPTVVNLAGIMTSIHADQTVVATEKDVRLDMVASSAFVQSDPVYLLRSIQNLVVNAIQYTSAGGRVLVGCRRRNGCVVLEVWDTGVGIATADQSRIFEEFARAGNEGLPEGMGLGLSVVERACRLLGHRLSVRSKPGVGSVFSIEMDIVEGAPSIEEPTDFLPASDALFEDRIFLVIENDADVLFGTTRWLEQLGASVLAAQSIGEALNHVAEIGIAPDIVLADFQLDGDEKGTDAIAQVRQQSGVHVPAILITADRSYSVRAIGIQNDISVMHKPVKLSRLRPLIAWKLGELPSEGGAGSTKVSGDSVDAGSRV